MFEASTSAVSNIPCDPDTVLSSDALMESDVPMVSDFTCGCWNTGSSVSSVTSEICTFAISSSAEAVFISPGLSGSVKISSTCGFSSTSIFETASSNA